MTTLITAILSVGVLGVANIIQSRLMAKSNEETLKAIKTINKSEYESMLKYMAKLSGQVEMLAIKVNMLNNAIENNTSRIDALTESVSLIKQPEAGSFESFQASSGETIKEMVDSFYVGMNGVNETLREAKGVMQQCSGQLSVLRNLTEVRNINTKRK